MGLETIQRMWSETVGKIDHLQMKVDRLSRMLESKYHDGRENCHTVSNRLQTSLLEKHIRDSAAGVTQLEDIDRPSPSLYWPGVELHGDLCRHGIATSLSESQPEGKELSTEDRGARNAPEGQASRLVGVKSHENVRASHQVVSLSKCLRLPRF